MSDSPELLKPDEVTDSELQIEIVNLKAENESLKQELEELRPPYHRFYTEIEQLKERNRLLLIKDREERQKLQEEISALKYRDESQSRRLQEKQARIDELDVQAEEARANYTAVTNKLREEVQEVRSQFAAEKVAHSATAQFYLQTIEESGDEEYAKQSKLQQEIEDLSEELEEVRSELSDLKQKLPTVEKDLPNAYDLLNRFKAKYPKSKVTPAEMKTILEIIEG
ncbi:hypothetical protein [Microcoleus asticus]|uniref:Chromosome partition protein Smc n=1 Tax=Microcoleus asticus IPMA8 TaxID=2563858 RepID=A0ABX2D6A2_9CYAN|nr:hypothetical protein [Microcoleus asticus]NQE38204.1 Chromosome partition protein Smc [Microcoleus asticus IPMA8]